MRAHAIARKFYSFATAPVRSVAPASIALVYVIGALITLASQIEARLGDCSAVGACLAQGAKGLGRSLVWPFSWGIRVAGNGVRGFLLGALILLAIPAAILAVPAIKRFAVSDNPTIRLTTRLYLIGGFVTLAAQLAARVGNCVTTEACLIEAAKALGRSLVWPFSWGVRIGGISGHGFLLGGLLLVAILAAIYGVPAVKRFAGSDNPSIRLTTRLYLIGGLATLAVQLAARVGSCVTIEASLIQIATALDQSLTWPLTWGIYVADSRVGFLLAGLVVIGLLAIGAGVDRRYRALTRPQEVLVVVLAAIALMAAEWLLLSVSPGTSFGNADGKAAEATIMTHFRFAPFLSLNVLNPLEGMWSQLLPMNGWSNFSFWPFAVFDRTIAANMSGVIGLGALFVASYIFARSFDISIFTSVVSSQLCILLFGPAINIFQFHSVFSVIPALAVVYASHIMAIAVLARLGSRKVSAISAAGVIFLLLFYSLYCDPLWTMVSGIAWAAAFLVVALAPVRRRPVIIRCAVLGGCLVLLVLSGALEYVFYLSQYTARVQFADAVSRPSAFVYASILYQSPTAKQYYVLCIIGWIFGLFLTKGRQKALVVAASVSALGLSIYTTLFLIGSSRWWLPLPVYVEHVLFPLFVVAAAAGWWHGIRHFGLGTPSHGGDGSKDSSASDTRRRNAPIALALLAVATIPLASLFFMDRAQRSAEANYERWPDEDDLVQFFTSRIGLNAGEPFHGSVAFSPIPAEALLSLYDLWMNAVPTINEYSQLVTPQMTYLNAELFKKDVAADLNRLTSWVSSAGSYDVLFKTLRAFGVRFILSYGDLPPAENQHFETSRLPRRLNVGSPGDWLVYELPDPNLGDYSPIEVIVRKSALDIVTALAGPSFAFRRQAVLADPAPTLTSATGVRVSVIRGGLHLTASSEGTSLLVLPMQFSHCLRASGKAELVRANLVMTGVIFSKEIDADITSAYGIFSPKCRRQDLADIKDLGMTLKPRPN